MEENKETVENTNVEETGKVDTQSTNKTEGEAKTFTQEEVNSMLKKEKQKAEKKFEGIDVAKYKEWVESQKTAEQKQAEKEAEYQAKDNTISELQKENKVLKAGVKDVEDVDYILFKVGKMEGEFDENLAKFLQDNPKYIKGEELTEPKATGTSVKKIGSNNDDGVIAILKSRHPEMNF
jgi:hypothetical protein